MLYPKIKNSALSVTVCGSSNFSNLVPQVLQSSTAYRKLNERNKNKNISCMFFGDDSLRDASAFCGLMADIIDIESLEIITGEMDASALEHLQDFRDCGDELDFSEFDNNDGFIVADSTGATQGDLYFLSIKSNPNIEELQHKIEKIIMPIAFVTEDFLDKYVNVDDDHINIDINESRECMRQYEAKKMEYFLTFGQGRRLA